MNAPAKIDTSIISALASALPELESAKKNKANPAFKSRYADLAAVIEAVQPIAAHGLWFRQVSHNVPDGVCIETIYIHGPSNTELSAGEVFVPADKRNAQGYGSAQSYARRYGLQAAFGLATEDDDGNAASKQAPAAAPSVVNDAQWSEIISLIQATNADTKAFCDAYKIESIRDLPAAAFERAKKQLNTKLAKMAEAEMEPT